MRCTHPGPIEFGASEVSWNAAGTVGFIACPCRVCGHIIDWGVE